MSCVWGLDVCAILRVSPDLLRGRFLTGKYFAVGRDGWGTLGQLLVHIDGQSVVVLVAEHITAVERVYWFERLFVSYRLGTGYSIPEF